MYLHSLLAAVTSCAECSAPKLRNGSDGLQAGWQPRALSLSLISCESAFGNALRFV